jgi:hypothetical protein
MKSKRIRGTESEDALTIVSASIHDGAQPLGEELKEPQLARREVLVLVAKDVRRRIRNIGPLLDQADEVEGQLVHEPVPKELALVLENLKELGFLGRHMRRLVLTLSECGAETLANELADTVPRCGHVEGELNAMLEVQAYEVFHIVRSRHAPVPGVA